jgi:GntR family transcriptional regulator
MSMRPLESGPFAGSLVSRLSGDHLYRQVAGFLRDAITTGKYEPGSLLPSEKDLCALFSVSRPVVRQALDLLSQEGHVYRVKGRGTFTAVRKLESYLVQVGAGPQRDTIRFSDRMRTRVLQGETMPADVDTARRLQLNVGAPVARLVRLRSLDDEPLCVLESCLPASLMPRLLEQDLTDVSLYGVMESRYGISIATIDRMIEAAPTAPDDAGLLAIVAGTPCLVVTSLASSSNEAPLEWSRARYRADRISLSTRFVADDPPREPST